MEQPLQCVEAVFLLYLNSILSNLIFQEMVPHFYFLHRINFYHHSRNGRYSLQRMEDFSWIITFK